MTDFNSEDPLLNLTLDTDELGIWLVDDRPEGPLQLGHISWKAITQGVQQAETQKVAWDIALKMEDLFPVSWRALRDEE